MDTTPQPTSPSSEAQSESTRSSSPVQEVGERVRSSAQAVGRQLNEVSWPELLAGAAMGFGIAYLMFTRRSPQSLSEVVSDSLRPWASHRLHDAVDTVKRSRPVTGLAQTIDRLRAS